MIFDDLTNIKLYKGIHPNLDQAIDFSMNTGKILLSQGDMISTVTRSFSLFKKTPLTKMKMIALNIIAVMPTFIYQLKGMNSLATVPVSQMKLFHLMKQVILALFIVRNSIHFIWVIIILQSSSLGNLTNQMVIQVRKKQSENIYSKLRLIRCLKQKMEEIGNIVSFFGEVKSSKR